MTPQQLHTKATQLGEQVLALKRERETLAPVAVNGSKHGPQARERIKAIDAERREIESELETIEDALASPEYRRATRQEMLVQRLDTAFAKRKRAHQANLTGSLCSRYDHLSYGDNLAIASGPSLPFGIEGLPYEIAAEITGETYAQQEVAGIENLSELHGNGDPRYDNISRREELQIRLAAYKRHTQELLADTKLPPIPPALQAKIDRLARGF